MKKPSGTRVNIMIMGIVVVVLALGLAAILGYGKARKQMEQMQQAQQEQEAKEAQITPTQTVTPEPTDDPTDPAVQKKNLITEIKKAVEHNDVKIMTRRSPVYITGRSGRSIYAGRCGSCFAASEKERERLPGFCGKTAG